MQSVLLFIAAVVLVGCVQAEDKCMPPKPGEKHTSPGDCCKFQGTLPNETMAAMHSCMEKSPRPPRPSGPPPPLKEMKNHHACLAECVFQEQGMLNTDKTVNINKFEDLITSNNNMEDLQPVIKAAVKECKTSYTDRIDRSMNCTSGAAELGMCVTNKIFVNCPESMWTSSSECKELQEKVKSCPDHPVLMGPPPHHDKHRD